jgi:multicomponent Na+:H+ antiporter subunit E
MSGRGRLCGRGRLPYTLWLVAVWVALWGNLSVANVIGGLAVALAVQLVFPGAGPGKARRVRPWALLHLVAYFAWQLVKANAMLAWEVMTPGRRLASGVIGVRLRTDSDAITTLVANAISLTPGTLTLTVRPDGPGCRMLYAHVLHSSDVEAVRANLVRLETLALRAFDAERERVP